MKGPGIPPWIECLPKPFFEKITGRWSIKHALESVQPGPQAITSLQDLLLDPL
jgi:hypothetical protein